MMRMPKGFLPNRGHGWPLLGFGIVLSVSLTLWLLWDNTGSPSLALLYWLGAGGCAGLVTWLVGVRQAKGNLAKEYQALVSDLRTGRQEMERRMALLMHLNHNLVHAQDEKAVMDLFLETITELTGATASSFVPLDDWGQPLSAFVYGNLPETVMKAWSEHLVAKSVREQCQACQVTRALPANRCPLLEEPFTETFSIFCLPMQYNERLLGKLNLYLPPEGVLSEDVLAMATGLLNQIAMMVQSVRLRNQELMTLRQLQMLRLPKTDLAALLTGLLEGLRQALEVDFILLRTRAWERHPSGLQLQCGQADWLTPGLLENLWRQALANSCPLEEVTSSGAWPGRQVAMIPLTLPDEQVVGFMVAASERPQAFNAHQAALWQSTAAQVALLVENERQILSLEYRAVIQERMRLAREIHDGLAQTLAYLKMQTVQMQHALLKKDMAHLSELLKQNHQALSSAYMDTRQAIDNLRLTPQQGMVHWLERTIADFEETSGLAVKRSFQLPDWELLPEVQSQLIRIVQEALSNVRKHAQASSAWVSLTEWDGDLIVEIRDDGRGFAPEDVPYPSQYGLRGMRERAEFIGADFQIISQPRQGTTIRLRLPRYQESPA